MATARVVLRSATKKGSHNLWSTKQHAPPPPPHQPLVSSSHKSPFLDDLATSWNTSLHSSVSVSSTSSTRFLSLPSPLWVPGARRLSTLAQQQQHHCQLGTGGLGWTSNTSRAVNRHVLDRIQRNLRRLQTRHWIELALMLAAAQRARREAWAEAADVASPEDWKNWSRKDWTDELLQSIGRNQFERFGSAMYRLVQLSLLAAPLAVLTPLGYVSPSIHQLSWDYAVWGVEQAGPTFIKWVQWATSRQDLFSPDFCQHFGKLRDETRGHSWEETKVILADELGPLVDRLQMEVEPVGSGCIAQVYRGVLTEPTGQFPAGTKLAIKVQHPNIWTKVCIDFYIMGKTAAFLESLPYLNLKYLSLVDLVRQFRDAMLPQMDLTLESGHLKRFNRNFSNDDRINFPLPLDDLTTKRVLTETFLKGKPILEFANKPEPLRKELADLGVETTLKMLFLHDFIHGDMHPGNILVGQSENGRACLNLLDCGLVIELGPDQHNHMTKILGSFARREGEKAGQYLVDSNSESQANAIEVENFIASIAKICNADTNFVEHLGEQITDICYLACRHHVKLDGGIINAALAVELVEGIARVLYPNVTVSSKALPILVKAELMHNLHKLTFW